MPARKPPLLTLASKVGNGSPAIEDLIAVQTAILTSNATVLGTVTEFRKGLDQRLDRQFGEVTLSVKVVEGKVDGMDGRLGSLEEERRKDAALAVQAKGFASDNATQAQATAADAKSTATERNTDRAQHALSKNQRMAILVSAVMGTCGVLLGVANFVAGK